MARKNIFKKIFKTLHFNLTGGRTTKQKNADEFWKQVEEAAKDLNIPDSALWMKELRLLD